MVTCRALALSLLLAALPAASIPFGRLARPPSAAPCSDLRLNEFLPLPAAVDWDQSGVVGPGDQWVELYNPSDAACSLDGWALARDGSSVVTLPSGIEIAPNGYAVLYCGQIGFFLTCPGELRLLRPDGGEAERYGYSVCAADQSYSRAPSPATGWECGFYLPSPGEANGSIAPSPTPSRAETATPTEEPSPTATSTDTPSPVPTATDTPSPTGTPTATREPSASPTPTATPTPSPTRTETVTRTPSPTRTATVSRTPSVTRTPTITRTPSVTRTPTATRTPSRTRTPTVTRTPSRTRTPTATRTPSRTRTPTVTRTPSRTRTPTVTRTPSCTPTPTATGAPTATPALDAGRPPSPLPVATTAPPAAATTAATAAILLPEAGLYATPDTGAWPEGIGAAPTPEPTPAPSPTPMPAGPPPFDQILAWILGGAGVLALVVSEVVVRRRRV